MPKYCIRKLNGDVITDVSSDEPATVASLIKKIGAQCNPGMLPKHLLRGEEDLAFDTTVEEIGEGVVLLTAVIEEDAVVPGHYVITPKPEAWFTNFDCCLTLGPSGVAKYNLHYEHEVVARGHFLSAESKVLQLWGTWERAWEREVDNVVILSFDQGCGEYNAVDNADDYEGMGNHGKCIKFDNGEDYEKGKGKRDKCSEFDSDDAYQKGKAKGAKCIKFDSEDDYQKGRGKGGAQGYTIEIKKGSIHIKGNRGFKFQDNKDRKGKGKGEEERTMPIKGKGITDELRMQEHSGMCTQLHLQHDKSKSALWGSNIDLWAVDSNANCVKSFQRSEIVGRGNCACHIGKGLKGKGKF